MKICITAQSGSIDAEVDPRFGRCAWFLIIDTETLQSDAIENNQGQSQGGAGVQAGQLLAESDVKTVLTGHAGPNAFQTLNAAGINVITGVSGTVREVVEKFKQGDYQISDQPDVESHFGSRM